MDSARHTLRVFDEDLTELRAMVCEMGGRVEVAVSEAATALCTGDDQRARRVITSDARIDEIGARIEQHAIRLIALRAPLADDLREVLAAFKISNLLERSGDCAKNIAHRVAEMRDFRRMDEMRIAASMEASVAAMLKAAIDSFATRNAGLAAEVRQMDEAVDEAHQCLFRALVDQMTQQPRCIGAATHLLLVSQKLERIGDHAVSIADMVRFALLGPGLPYAQQLFVTEGSGE